MALQCDFQVAEVCYAASSGLKYLVLRLEDGISRQQLEAIQPDMAGKTRVRDFKVDVGMDHQDPDPGSWIQY